RLRTRQTHHGMAARDQFADHGGANNTRPTKNQNAHRIASRGSTPTRASLRARSIRISRRNAANTHSSQSNGPRKNFFLDPLSFSILFRSLRLARAPLLTRSRYANIFLV